MTLTRPRCFAPGPPFRASTTGPSAGADGRGAADVVQSVVFCFLGVDAR